MGKFKHGVNIMEILDLSGDSDRATKKVKQLVEFGENHFILENVSKYGNDAGLGILQYELEAESAKEKHPMTFFIDGVGSITRSDRYSYMDEDDIYTPYIAIYYPPEDQLIVMQGTLSLECPL
jgi:hypothetical protein